MAVQQVIPAPRTPAPSRSYPMARPGYGKRSMPGQLPRHADDFALLPARERYIAGFVDQLPDGASMDVKSLAKQLPLYGQQAVASALKALAAAGYLRRVRCLVGEQGQVRWVSRTFWSRTARDNEWWAATEVTTTALTAPAAPAPATPTPMPAAPAPAVSPAPRAPFGTAGKTRAAGPAEPSAAPAPCASAPVPVPVPPRSPEDSAVPRVAASPVAPASPAFVPGSAPTSSEARGRTAEFPSAPPADSPAPRPAESRSPSPAYLALARLGRVDARLALSAADCEALEPRAAEWLARGVDADYLTLALTAGLPAQVGSPAGLVRRRLADKIPPHAPAAPTPALAGTPVRRVMLECTKCGTPGRAEALPDGLCRPCRKPGGHDAAREAVGRPSEEDVRTFTAGLRTLLRSP
ncbi:MarR family transcriptional regulator [Streptomyces sp. NPDC051784]|uniref:MarR family transcriptional regulator n=1 Tax=Streptomyces sp. NPDC051784 TaxID=3155805 RepID=UPI0034173935